MRGNWDFIDMINGVCLPCWDGSNWVSSASGMISCSGSTSIEIKQVQKSNNQYECNAQAHDNVVKWNVFGADVLLIPFKRNAL